jgi:hypothetical protein
VQAFFWLSSVLPSSSRAGIVTVPFHRKDLKLGTLKSILDQAGLSTDDFLKLP